MRQLHAAASAASPRTFHQFEATHNDIWVKGGRRYWDAKRGFIEGVLADGDFVKVPRAGVEGGPGTKVSPAGVEGGPGTEEC